MQSKATATLRPRLALPKVELQNYVVYLFFAVVLAFFAVTIGDKGFLSVMNLFNIARTTAMITVIAVAMTFVISAGELDLSVGSIAALSALTCGLVIQAGFAWPLAALAGIAAGLMVGCLNGFFVTMIGIPSFLVTLGMMQFVRGLDMRVTYTNPIATTNKTFTRLFGSGSLFGIHSLLIWSASVALLGFVVLKYTGFGRKILATGGNRMVAEYSGVKIRRIKFAAFLLSGAAAALEPSSISRRPARCRSRPISPSRPTPGFAASLPRWWTWPRRATSAVCRRSRSTRFRPAPRPWPATATSV